MLYQFNIKSQKTINNIKLLKVSCLLALFISFTSCKTDDAQETPNTQWKIVWQDEFNIAGPIDESIWNFDLGGGGWGNNELQTYTSDPENVKIEDGLLKITALNEPITSARINTKGKFSQQYGRFEARIKTPFSPGMWPAFWMLGSDIDENPWPAAGEIDIMELRGQQPSIIHGSVHAPGNFGGNPITKSYGLNGDRFDNDFHLFAVEWSEESIDYYVDDFLYQRITPSDVEEWVFNKPFYILLNLAVGGDFVGFPTSNTVYPQTLEVDYVRVYKEL